MRFSRLETRLVRARAPLLPLLVVSSHGGVGRRGVRRQTTPPVAFTTVTTSATVTGVTAVAVTMRTCHWTSATLGTSTTAFSTIITTVVEPLVAVTVTKVPGRGLGRSGWGMRWELGRGGKRLTV